MKKNYKTRITASLVTAICLISNLVLLLYKRADNSHAYDSTDITEAIAKVISDYPGEIGIAAIINNTDTITVNNKNIYPMMSVFKVHQALAVCDYFDRKRISIDSIVTIHRDELDPKTWSPMLKEHPEPVIF